MGMLVVEGDVLVGIGGDAGRDRRRCWSWKRRWVVGEYEAVFGDVLVVWEKSCCWSVG